MKDFLKYFKLTIFFGSVFLILHIIHFNFFTKGIILYAVLFDIFLAVFVGIMLLRFFGKKPDFIMTVSSITFILIAIIYNILFPVMVDRSVSVNLLLTLYNAPEQKMSISELRQKLGEVDILEKRFNEQQKTGLIKIKDGIAEITKKGKIAASVFSLDSKILNLNPDIKTKEIPNEIQ